MQIFICDGRLTADPEIFHTQKGVARVRFTLAVENGQWTNDDGEKVKDVQFLDFTAWEKVGEFVMKYFTKGKPMQVFSTAKKESWSDKESGEKRSKVGFRVDKVNFVLTNGKNDSSDDNTEDEVEKPAPKKSSFSPKKTVKKQNVNSDLDELESEVL